MFVERESGCSTVVSRVVVSNVVGGRPSNRNGYLVGVAFESLMMLE